MITTNPVVDFTNQPFAPGTTPMVTAQFVDQFGVPIPLLAIFSFTLSIVDRVTGVTINSVLDTPIKNADRGKVFPDGSFQIQLLAADTAMTQSIDPIEYRSLIIVWTWNGGAQVGKRQYDLLIDALAGS